MIMLKYFNGVILELTEEEEAEIKDALSQYKKRELKKPMTQTEVIDMLIKQLVNTVDIPDKTSIRMKDYYPTFDEIVEKGEPVRMGFKFMYEGNLWKTRQDNLTFQSIYPPGINTAALYEMINEENTGEKDDPIPYDPNMQVYKDLYYIYDEIIYLCIRSSGNPLYYNPDVLLGNYFEIA